LTHKNVSYPAVKEKYGKRQRKACFKEIMTSAGLQIWTDISPSFWILGFISKLHNNIIEC
jgi:hypothetical protein